MAKFCTQCGAKLNEGDKFCKQCGAKVPGTEKQEPAEEKKQPASSGSSIKEKILKEQKRENIKKAVIGIAVALVLFLAGSFILGGSDEDIVRKGNFSFNQRVTVGKAFDNFFDGPKWSAREVNGVHYVYFEGNMANGRDNSKEKAKISFKVNPKQQTFELIRMEINGREVTDPEEPLRQICEGRENIEYHTRSY